MFKMSSAYGILYAILTGALVLFLFFSGLFVAGDVMRSHPLVTFSLLLCSGLMSFLSYKTDKPADPSFQKYIFYSSVILAGCTFLFHNKTETYLQKFLLGGKVKSEKVVLTNGEDGHEYEGRDYYLEGGNDNSKEAVNWGFIILTIGTPLLTWKISKLAGVDYGSS
ncbi:MAG TPA: hypothetical protein VGQ53_18970 [Chitinophagaceae bacterium]|jgi:hypothetical protein|nr:hypothetical protein [Chitinophagaceae bacterium]